MRYFTTEWQTAWQFAKNEEERKKLDKETARVCREYEKQFDKIKPRFSKKFITFYDKHYRFHDSEIKDFTVSRRKGKTVPLVHVMMTLNIDGVLYRLKYHAVSKIEYKADFLNSDIEFMKWREQFDVWMYDEFLPIDSDTIQHDISFLSGSELMIACKKVSIEKI